MSHSEQLGGNVAGNWISLCHSGLGYTDISGPDGGANGPQRRLRILSPTVCQARHKDTKADDSNARGPRWPCMCAVNAAVFFWEKPRNSNDTVARGKMTHEKEDGKSRRKPMSVFKSYRGHRAESGLKQRAETLLWLAEWKSMVLVIIPDKHTIKCKVLKEQFHNTKPFFHENKPSAKAASEQRAGLILV